MRTEEKTTHKHFTYSHTTQGWKQNGELLFLQNCSITKVPSIRYFPFYFLKKNPTCIFFFWGIARFARDKRVMPWVPSFRGGGHKIRRDKGTYKEEEEEEETVGDKNKQRVGRDMDTWRDLSLCLGLILANRDSPKWWFFLEITKLQGKDGIFVEKIL